MGRVDRSGCWEPSRTSPSARADRDLAASEARYRQLLEQTSDGVWRVGVEERTDYVNPRMAEMLGYEPTEMLGRELADFMDPEWLQTAQQTIARDRSHAAKTMLECCFRRKDGKACWARVSTTALFDGDRNDTGALAIMCDVTAAKARGGGASYVRAVRFGDHRQHGGRDVRA